MAAQTDRATELQRAFERLLTALEEFQAAYEAWAQLGDGDVEELSALLAVAERKVDAARAALADLEARLSDA